MSGFGLVLLILAAFAGNAAPAGAAVGEDIESILSGRGYQRTLPHATAASSRNRPSSRGEATVPDFPDDFGDAPEHSPSPAGPVVKLLLWVFVAVGAVLLVVHLADLASRFRLRPRAARQVAGETESEDAAQIPDAATLPATLDEIERLAREGAFGDAVHLILLHCFEDLRRRSSYARDPALTSREILARATLPASAQASLAFIVSAVESGHFGGQAINRPVYERCFAGYRDIAMSGGS